MTKPTAPALGTRQLEIGSGARTIFGTGSVARLAGGVRGLGGSRVFVVTDSGLVASGLTGRLASLLEDDGLEVGLFSELRPNPTGADVLAGGAALKRFGQAVVVGLGGGTALDGAKAISLAAVNDVPASELDYRSERLRPGHPVVAVPTTAGTGSETNGFGVFEDHEVRRKFYVGHSSVAPRLVVLDPELTRALPPQATAATGIDALTHALESLMAKHRNPYAHALDLQVVRAVHAWLPVAVTSGDDVEARSQMLLSAHMAGLAFGTTGLGLCHALGHGLSAMLGTAHGVALAVVLPSVMTFNLPARSAQLAEVSALLGLAEPGGDEPAAALAAVDEVRQLCARLGMPASLGQLGLTASMVPELVRTALDDVVLANNPVQPAAGQLTAMVEALL